MRTVLFDIDTQRDFMEPGGGLYVEGAERIVPALHRVLTAARDHGVPVVATVDAHLPGDPEFAQFPPHCVKGTRGQEKIPQTLVRPLAVVPDRSVEVDLPPEGGILVEKRTFSFLDNPNAGAILALLAPERCVVVGVTTEICVRAAAFGLMGRGCEVVVVSDAVCPIKADSGARTIDEMLAAGIRVVSADEAIVMMQGRRGDRSNRG